MRRKSRSRSMQDGVGSRVVTWDAVFVWGLGLPQPVLTTTANLRDFVGLIYNATSAKWMGIAFANGYA